MMTFKEVTYKIFKTNFRRYLLYFLCSSFTVLVFFVYSTLYTNKKLMNSPQIGSNIASMFIAPTIGLIIFSVFLIIYSHNSFNKLRRKELGMFMVLGMTKAEIRKIIVFENSLIGFLSIITGLALGTIFSRLFYYITLKIINIDNIPYEFSLKSYLYTILLFTAIYIVVILISAITSLKYEIINLLKESRKEDRNLINKPIFGLLGILLITISFADILINFKNDNSYVLFRSFLMCMIGIYFFISNIAWLISKIKNINKAKYYKNVLFVTNLKYTFGQSKKIIFLITLLVAITVFFSSISIIIISDSQRLAKGYNPYDIAYVKLSLKNNIPEKDLNKIIISEDNKLTSEKSLEFIYAQRQTLLSDKNLNEVLGYNFHVEKGHYISLFQIIKDDGYAYDTNIISSMNLEATSGKNQYSSNETLTQVLFNRFPVFQDSHYLIFNNDDYLDIKGKLNSNQLGYIKLMNFKDWSKTKDIYSNLSAELDKYNKENTKPYFENPTVDSYMFQPVSRIDDYMKRRASGEFSLFLFSFTGILFLVASAALLHFKLQTEYEREKIKYKKLHKIGITAKEVKNMISKEFRVLFFLPYIFGILLASFYSYSLPVQQGKGGASAMYSLIIGIVYLIFQILYYLFYKAIYIRRLFVDLNR